MISKLFVFKDWNKKLVVISRKLASNLSLITFHLSLITSLFLFSSCVDEEEYPDTPEGNMEALWRIIDEHYCFLDYKKEAYGLDWNEVHQRYKSRVDAAMTKGQLFEVLADMLSELRDGHVNLSAAHDYARYWSWFENSPTNLSDSLLRRYMGTNYRMALSKSTETAWVSKPSGEYAGSQAIKLTAVSQSADAQLIYTLDGSDPTANNGNIVSNGSTVTISQDCTLKAGLLINGQVSGVITRHYVIGPESHSESSTITVYLKDPTVAPNNWPRVNFYSWDSNGSMMNDGWPGQTITDIKEANGIKFYYQTYEIPSSDYCLNFVFNQGGTTAGEHQTVDVTNVRKTSVFEVTSQENKYEVEE